jgi:hypothetical protein
MSDNEAKRDPPVRQRHGFSRTVCDCVFCRVPCRHVPGGLDPEDLDRLCPPGQDLFAWAEEHLRALTNQPYPILVPARAAHGGCHWHFQGKCAVHENAPYGCAFFDAHQSDSEVAQRYAATVRARQQDAAQQGIYYQVWLYLCQRGLIGVPGKRSTLEREVKSLLEQGHHFATE